MFEKGGHIGKIPGTENSEERLIVYPENFIVVAYFILGAKF